MWRSGATPQSRPTGRGSLPPPPALLAAPSSARAARRRPAGEHIHVHIHILGHGLCHHLARHAPGIDRSAPSLLAGAARRPASPTRRHIRSQLFHTGLSRCTALWCTRIRHGLAPAGPDRDTRPHATFNTGQPRF